MQLVIMSKQLLIFLEILLKVIHVSTLLGLWIIVRLNSAETPCMCIIHIYLLSRNYFLVMLVCVLLLHKNCNCLDISQNGQYVEKWCESHKGEPSAGLHEDMNFGIKFAIANYRWRKFRMHFHGLQKVFQQCAPPLHTCVLLIWAPDRNNTRRTRFGGGRAARADASNAVQCA